MTDGVCPFAVWKPVPSNIYGHGSINRVAFCDHTAGGFFTTLSDNAFWIRLGYCPHFSTGRKGQLQQHVNIFDRAWAQGRDANGDSVGPWSPGITWPGFDDMHQVNPNEYMISTEHEDAILVDDQVVFVPGSRWTPEQYAIDLRCKRWSVAEVRRVTGQNLLTFGLDSLAGHHMFDPVSRASCPGRVWRDEYRAQLYDDLQEETPLTPHNVVATWFNERTIDAGGPYRLTARSDFGLPADAKRVRFGVYLSAGPGYLRFFNASGDEAEPAGWGLTPQYSTVEATMRDDGSIAFQVEDGRVRIAVLRSLGYWTA